MVELLDAEVSIDLLLLDPNNYRFQDLVDHVSAAEDRFAEETVQARALARLQEAGLAELKGSIVHNGFLPFEKIVVREYDDARYLVLEGNRRVAALKSIKNDHQAGVNFDDELVDVLDAVPVIVAKGIESDPTLPLSLMGIRHVGGIKQWGGYQRAKLITELRDDFGLDTGEVADRLGLTAHEVNRRYRAFKALQQAMDDEEFGGAIVPNMYPIFHEAVSVRAVKEWLSWDEASFSFSDADNCAFFYSLISPAQGDDGTMEPKIKTYSDVRDLREILPLPDARRRLADPEASFADALAIAKADHLARSWVSEVGEAVVALGNVGVLELKRASDEDVALIRELMETAEELLASREALVGKK